MEDDTATPRKDEDCAAFIEYADEEMAAYGYADEDTALLGSDETKAGSELV